MNTTMSTLLKTSLAVVLLAVAGCASQSGKPAATVKKPATPKEEPSFAAILRKPGATPSAPLEGQGWKPLFDGKSLTGWYVTRFGVHGAVQCENGLLVVNMGDALSGITWTNPIPKSNYEIALDAMRLEGSDFYCGLTFPVGASHCS